MATPLWSERLVEGLPLTAASFIVTVYGDLVVPRGEVLWTGSLIGICAGVGISENPVRTATSRLVAAGRLEGEKQGRRSYYRLAEAARAEFADAARLLYAPGVSAAGWLVLQAPGLAEDLARQWRMGRMGPETWLCPDLGVPPPPVPLAMRAELPADPAALSVMAGFWDLGRLEARYRAMIDRFAPLDRALQSGERVDPREALVARLLLVHVYRGVLLRDPCLPAGALPPDWHGAEARALFRSLYLALSPAAEQAIAEGLEGRDGPLAPTTDETSRRALALL